ncbi:DNA replication complex GINS protein SLD5-like protein [Camelus ferus]|nr:DNA replication complex GINS protein SLD5-like protein [Camelus ferus]
MCSLESSRIHVMRAENDSIKGLVRTALPPVVFGRTSRECPGLAACQPGVSRSVPPAQVSIRRVSVCAGVWGGDDPVLMAPGEERSGRKVLLVSLRLRGHALGPITAFPKHFRFLVSEMMTEELDVSGQDSDGGSEEVVLTPAELIDRLEQAWMNEKFAPELLETKSEIVECVIEQLDHMEENLRRAKKGDLKVSIHQMEMERIRYVLSSYLRCRLMKIEKFFPHILEKEKTRGEGEPSSLSPEEFAFAKEYMTNTETYLKNVALKHMPPNLQKVDLLKAVPKPDLDSYVFLRVKERQENLLVEPETDEQRDYVIDLEEGSQHLIRYKTIAPLVASGAVQLI